MNTGTRSPMARNVLTICLAMVLCLGGGRGDSPQVSLVDSPGGIASEEPCFYQFSRRQCLHFLAAHLALQFLMTDSSFTGPVSTAIFSRPQCQKTSQVQRNIGARLWFQARVIGGVWLVSREHELDFGGRLRILEDSGILLLLLNMVI